MKKIIVSVLFITTFFFNTIFCMEPCEVAMIASLKTKPYTYSSIDLLSNNAARLKSLTTKEKEKGRYSRRLRAAGETLEPLLKHQGFGIDIEKMFGTEAINLAQLVVKKEAIKRELFDLVDAFFQSSVPSHVVWRKFHQINREFPDVINAYYSEINGATLLHCIAVVYQDIALCSVILATCDKINPNVVDKDGNTVLHRALMSGITPERIIKSSAY